MAQEMVQPSPSPQTAAHVLEEPVMSLGSRLGSVGGGIIAATCWGSGIAAVAAALVGWVPTVLWMRSALNAQAWVLISDVIGIGLIVALAFWQVRRMRRWMAPADFRRVFGRSLYRLAAWALVGYMAYMVFSGPILKAVGFALPTK